MRVKMVGAVLAALLLVGVIAPAAVAGDQGVGVIVGGRAQVGTDNDTCTKDVQTKPTGNGIVIPDGGVQNYKYRLQVPNKNGQGQLIVAGTSTNTDNGKSPVPHVGLGTLSICGNVGPVGGGSGGLVPSLGAWCGLSKGYNGTGKLTVDWVDGLPDDVQRYQLHGLTWKASAGTLLPVIGKWQKLNDAGSTKKDLWGNIIAVVSARSVSGESTCLQATGGRVFDVDGVTALVSSPVNKGKDSVIRINDLPGMAKPGPVYGPKAKPAQPKG